jgi:hypothetical protein
MGEEERPDKTMVILDSFKIPGGLPEGTLQIWEVGEGRLDSDYVRWYTRFTTEKGVWVSHIPCRGKKKMFVPKGRTPTEHEASSMEENDFEVVEFSP